MRAVVLGTGVLGLVLYGIATAQQQIPIRIEDFVLPSTDGVTQVKDPVAPLTFKLPPGWQLRGGVRWGNYETTLSLAKASSDLTASLYYQYPLETTRSSDPDIALHGFMQSKVRQRRDREGLRDYAIREATVQRRTVAGRPALSFFADYTGATRVPMVEYVLRLMGASIKAHVFITAPATLNIAPFAKEVDAILESLQIPEFPAR